MSALRKVSRARSLALALPLVFALLLVAAEAAGRVGGGQGFSGGGSSGGGSSGGGSSGGASGGGDGSIVDLIALLIWLCIEVPVIGIPLVCGLLTLVVLYFAFGGARTAMRRLGSGADRSSAALSGTSSKRSRSVQTRRAPQGADFGKILAADPAFSMPVLLDFVQLVHRRATEAAARKDWEPLLPFVSEGARTQLEGIHTGVASVSDVIEGALTPVSTVVSGSRQRVVFAIENARREHLADGSERRVALTEQWTFERSADARSLPPDAVQRMGCPSCGAASATDAQGRCKSCETVITDGKMQWLCTAVTVSAPRRPLSAPDYAPAPGGVEPGFHEPTIVAPDLPVRLRSLIGRHPDFSADNFRTTAVSIFTALQSAWSAGRWEQARPYTTDPMFDTLRFWMDRYAAGGLRNRIEDVSVERVEIVDVAPDAWYEAVTVRIWAHAKDYVTDAKGNVVGGNANQPRSFSEYWTFLRSSGGSAASKDSLHCPSCGAALDRVNQAGICGYCDTRITSGEFTWVLSRIAQPEAYRG